MRALIINAVVVSWAVAGALQAQDDQAPTVVADPAELAFEEGRWNDAIGEYREILAAYPEDRLSLLRIAQASRQSIALFHNLVERFIFRRFCSRVGSGANFFNVQRVAQPGNLLLTGRNLQLQARHLRGLQSDQIIQRLLFRGEVCLMQRQRRDRFATYGMSMASQMIGSQRNRK